MTPHRLGVAVLGTGIMGRRMLATLASHPRFRIVGLWDPDPDALQEARAMAPDARRAVDPADLVSDPAADLVYVASPPAWHLPGVRAALAAGRACLCEKPLAANVAEAVALRDAVIAAGTPFAVNFPFASAPASRRLARLVHDGALGTIDSASITLRFAHWPRAWQAGASGWLAGPAEGGFTREVLSHFVFLALRLFGPATVTDVALTRVGGRAENAEDTLRARLVHRDVAIAIDGAVGGTDAATPADHNRFEIVGSKGTAALTDWSRLDGDGAANDGDAPILDAPDRLARLVAGHLDHDLATADEGLAVVRCIEAMLIR